ncbi:MAG: putative membrane protein [Parcubacteria group bacterium Gr01-1014_33]|nr:MAG: putative membrane protein [Parcubacteria group bacterium Gr01-1014_33]
MADVWGKFILKIGVNAVILLLARHFFSGFILTDTIRALLFGSIIFALLSTILTPLLKLLFLPVIWITLGAFNIAIAMFLLWIADLLLPQLTILNFSTLFWLGIIFGIVNSFL